MTLHPLGLQIPSSSSWGGSRCGEVGVCVGELSIPPTQRLSFAYISIGVQAVVTALGE